MQSLLGPSRSDIHIHSSTPREGAAITTAPLEGHSVLTASVSVPKSFLHHVPYTRTLRGTSVPGWVQSGRQEKG